jgi:inosine-uridine nucleoside N-ribohydrolase
VKRKVIIDADPGIGDALAILLALLDPDIDVVGVTAVPGCVSGEMALLNAQAVVSLLDPPRWPRLGMTEGRPVSVPRESGNVDPVFLHGETGLGDLDVPNVELHHRIDAAKLLVDLVRDEPGELTLLTLGPLTNVVLACERSPEFLGNLKELVCCCGAMAVSGDVTAAAEFNVYANPEAARTVLTSLSTKTMAPLDVSRKVVLSFDHYDRLRIDETTRVGRLISHMLPFALRAQRQHLGQEGLTLHEVAALVSISQPRLFERRSLPVDVETDGSLTRGMTIFDRRKKSSRTPNIDVLTDVDAQGVLDYMTERLREARRR